MVAPAPSPEAVATPVTRAALAPRRLTPAQVGLVAGLLTLAAVLLAVRPERETVFDGLSWSTSAAASLEWVSLALLVTCSALHYVAATGALQAATGRILPFGATTAAQLAASAANKVTPAGLGGSAVLARFLARRADVPTGQAVGAVAVLAAARAVAGGLTLGALALVRPGARTEIVTLGHRLASPRTLPWLAGSAGLVVALVAVAAVRRRRRAGAGPSRLTGLGDPIRAVARCPRRLGGVLGCSMAQSVVLGVAFAAATEVVPGPHPHVPAVALVAGYLVGSAAAAAIPMPGGIGSAEAALTAVLVAAHVPFAHAVVDVTVFRVVTLWLPAVAGLPCAALLRRRGAL
jgi:uncharacterized membrane protein YbhN (UPF0104 family)